MDVRNGREGEVEKMVMVINDKGIRIGKIKKEYKKNIMNNETRWMWEVEEKERWKWWWWWWNKKSTEKNLNDEYEKEKKTR